MPNVGLTQSLWYRTSGDNGDALSAATFASQFTKIDIVKDLTLSYEHSRADSSDRSTNVRTYEKAIVDFSVAFNFNNNPDNTLAEAMLTAMLADTEHEFVMANTTAAPAAGEKAWNFTAKVYGGSQEEPLEDMVNVSVTLLPTDTIDVDRDAMPS